MGVIFEVFFEDNTSDTILSLSEINTLKKTVYGIRSFDTSPELQRQIASKFSLDLSSFRKKEDIEISSHYIDTKSQLTLNISIPIFNSQNIHNEESLHIILKEKIVFIFISKKLYDTINSLSFPKYDISKFSFQSSLDYLVFQLGILSDYYADLVEYTSHNIKQIYQDVINAKDFTESKLDALTNLNFSNFLIRESVSEYQRVLLLLRKKFNNNQDIVQKLEIEINDLNMVNEHLIYNFDRISDLKNNISSKIELEQNNIFKILTIFTVSLSLPTLIAGIYGMNFKYMPELNIYLAYPIVLVAILLSFLLPLIYFKYKKWF